MRATPADAASWAVEHRHGTAQELHDLDVAPRRTLLVLEVSGPALVLGSTQAEADVDPTALARAGVDLARRRSGGGAVLLVPGEHVWVDVVLPAGDPLWVDDVERSSWWLGAAWVEALVGAATGAAPVVHHGGVTDRALGRRVCFAATGPGEVQVGRRKLVGLSQRRTRELARFQCVVHRRFDPSATPALLAAGDDGVAAALRDGVTDLASVGIRPGWDVVEGLRAQLP